MKFSINDFFSKCDQIHRELWIWSHLLKKSLMENVIFLWSVTGSGKFKANFHIFYRWSRICKQHIKCPKQIWDGWIQLFSYPTHLCRYLLVSMYFISTYIMFQQWRFMISQHLSFQSWYNKNFQTQTLFTQFRFASKMLWRPLRDIRRNLRNTFKAAKLSEKC